MREPLVPAAVLWDMDGTLVDTEPYWFAAEHALVAAHGGTWTDEDAHSVVGFALLDSARVLRDRGGVDMGLEAIVDALLDDVVERCRAALPWRPGARELLTECRDAGIPCALVTMSWARLADALVTAAPPGAFAAVVTGDVVVRGKPHPEPYTTAAQRLGVDPHRCVAIEDSPTGVASAAAAGCVTIAVPHMVPIEPRPGVVIRPTLGGFDLEAMRAAVATAR